MVPFWCLSVKSSFHDVDNLPLFSWLVLLDFTNYFTEPTFGFVDCGFHFIDFGLIFVISLLILD